MKPVEKLHLLADWFDAKYPNDSNTEVQTDLRQFAAVIDAAQNYCWHTSTKNLEELKEALAKLDESEQLKEDLEDQRIVERDEIRDYLDRNYDDPYLSIPNRIANYALTLLDENEKLKAENILLKESVEYTRACLNLVVRKDYPNANL